MPRYRIEWVDHSTFEAFIVANSKESAIKRFEEQGFDAFEKPGKYEYLDTDHDYDNLLIEEV